MYTKPEEKSDEQIEKELSELSHDDQKLLFRLCGDLAQCLGEQPAGCALVLMRTEDTVSVMSMNADFDDIRQMLEGAVDMYKHLATRPEQTYLN